MAGFFKKPFKKIFGTNGKQGSHDLGMPLYGNLADRSLVEILSYCEKSFLNGRVVVVHGADQGSFLYLDGRLQKAILKDLPEDEAFDRMLDWQAGQYEIRPTAVMESDAPSASAETSLISCHIFILSINKLRRKIIDRELRSNGHHTYVIDSPMTTVKMLRSTNPDLMILDTSLPADLLNELVRTTRDISGVSIILVCEDDERNFLKGIARTYPNIYLTNSTEVEEIQRVVNLIIAPDEDGLGLW